MTEIYTDINGFVTYHVTPTYGRGHGFEITGTARDGYTFDVAEAHDFPTAQDAAQEAKQRLAGVVASILLWPENSASRHIPPLTRHASTNRYTVVHSVRQVVDADDRAHAEEMARKAIEDSTPLRFPTISEAGEVHPLPEDE